MNNKIKLTTILLSIILIMSNISTIVIADEKDDDVTIIKVGYCEDYAIIKAPMLEGYEGYGWEYLNEISQNMDGNYKFEFIIGSWSEGLERLKSGEIDLLGPANYTEDRLEDFIFTSEIFGTESVVLTSLDPEYITNSSYMKIQNGKIGVVKGDATIEYLYEYLDEHNLSPTIIETDISDFSYELEQQRFDYFLTGSLQMESELNIVLNLGSNPIYLMGNKDSKEYIDKIDNAIRKIKREQYMLQEQLYFKYFNIDSSKNQYIADEEYALLQEQDIYNVGIFDIYANSNNTFNSAGIAGDVVNFIAKKTGINVNLIQVNTSTSFDELESLDFYLPLDDYKSNENVKQSKSYIKTPLVIIEKTEDGKVIDGLLGMPSYYGFDENSTHYLMSEQDVEFYNYINRLLDDFNNGNLSKMVLTDATYRIMYKEYNNIDHSTRTTEFQLGPKIVYSNDFSEEKIEIIDKVISYIDSEFIESSILKNLELISEMERKNLLKNYSRIMVMLILLAMIMFVSYNKVKQKQLDKLSTQDILTGLLSQSKFIELARTQLNENPQKDYTMLTLDVDNFKYINKIYGYEIGSNILKHIANCIQNIIGDEVLFARISGDNFILMFENNQYYLDEIVDMTSSDSVFSNKISNLIERGYVITLSIGCYSIDDKSLDISYMMDSCNIARTHSKHQLGTVLKHFVEEMREQEDIKNNIESNMHNAIKNKEFIIYYQPKFDISSLKIVGAEALVRWQTKSKLIPPNYFIPVFENNGFIENLDYYVLNEVCEFISKNKNMDIPQISVNLSGITIMKKELVSNIDKITKKHNIDPQKLDLEITESAFVENFSVAVNRIDELRKLGYTISMDDFGSGISSLGRLKDISIDILKIDREFIIKSLEHNKTKVIIKNIIAMARELDIETIAEGIETKEQLQFLDEIGCDIGQGYYVARPMPELDFIDVLLKDRDD